MLTLTRLISVVSFTSWATAIPGGSGVVGNGAVGRGADGRAGGGPDRLIPEVAEGLGAEGTGGPRGPADSDIIGVTAVFRVPLTLPTLLSLPPGEG